MAGFPVGKAVHSTEYNVVLNNNVNDFDPSAMGADYYLNEFTAYNLIQGEGGIYIDEGVDNIIELD